jgi:hypothetical protein
MTQAAILTGDLVGSTRAGPEAVEKAMKVLARSSADLEDYCDIGPTRFTRSRGDGWQIVIMPTRMTLRAVTFLIARLRAADVDIETRIGIGLGTITKPGTYDLSDAAGTAFVNSGYALDDIIPSDRLAVRGLPQAELLWYESALETLSYLSGRWSKEQAQALIWRLPIRTIPLHAIGDHLNISRQALSSRLAVAGEKPIMAAIRAAEATL